MSTTKRFKMELLIYLEERIQVAGVSELVQTSWPFWKYDSIGVTG
jgi:hypothetical protein